LSAARRETYLTDRIGPLPFCPGCGHSALVKALDKALVRLQPDPAKVVIVTDIGCIGLCDRHFVTSAFHGLHGRSITYACGLKLARPELTAITLMGDGGCGIGGTHLLNVARRNIGITLIVGNNFNYGMTGGQHSVTTPTGGITSTTPWGNVEGPMDLCATAVAAGASWVYRTTTFEKDLPEVIAQAIAQPGFAMLDVWELCSAHYMARNKLGRKELEALAGQHGLRFGLLADRPRPEYSERYRQAYEEGKGVLRKRPRIEPKYGHAVTRQTGIIVAGSAGQRIRSAAALFAEAGIFAGLHATQKDDYPITVRTGHSVSEIIVSPETIDYTGIDSADCIVVISEDGLRKVRSRIEKSGDTCTVYADESLEIPETRARIRRLPLARVASQAGKLAVSLGALSAVLADTRLFPVEALETAVRTFQAPAIVAAGLDAVTAGRELARGL
jgi:2-oxoglutarate ferredoxin oxidoreductase subunit beta